MSEFIIDNSDDSGKWTKRLSYAYFSTAKTKFKEILDEEAQMDEMNSGGGDKSPEVQRLEKKVADLTSQLESMKKTYEE